MERFVRRIGAVLHQQYPAARRRHASDGPAAGDDADAQRLYREGRAGQEGEGRDDRRRHARRSHRGTFDQGAGAEVLVANQGQASLVGDPADRSGNCRHQAQRVSARKPHGLAHHLQQDHRRGPRTRGRPQGARTHPAQRDSRRNGFAGQACRLPGARSCALRALPRRR